MKAQNDKREHFRLRFYSRENVRSTENFRCGCRVRNKLRRKLRLSNILKLWVIKTRSGSFKLSGKFVCEKWPWRLGRVLRICTMSHGAVICCPTGEVVPCGKTIWICIHATGCNPHGDTGILSFVLVKSNGEDLMKSTILFRLGIKKASGMELRFALTFEIINQVRLPWKQRHIPWSLRVDMKKASELEDSSRASSLAVTHCLTLTMEIVSHPKFRPVDFWPSKHLCENTRTSARFVSTQLQTK